MTKTVMLSGIFMFILTFAQIDKTHACECNCNTASKKIITTEVVKIPMPQITESTIRRHNERGFELLHIYKEVVRNKEHTVYIFVKKE